MNTEYLGWHPQSSGPMPRGKNGDERIDPWALVCPEVRPRLSILAERSPSQGADTHRCKRQRQAEMLLLRLEVPGEHRSHASKQSFRDTPKRSDGQRGNRLPLSVYARPARQYSHEHSQPVGDGRGREVTGSLCGVPLPPIRQRPRGLLPLTLVTLGGLCLPGGAPP